MLNEQKQKRIHELLIKLKNLKERAKTLWQKETNESDLKKLKQIQSKLKSKL